MLILFKSSPYSSAKAREGIDMLLVASAFNYSINVLFIDDGVFLLTPDQSPNAIYQKSHSSILEVLDLYDVHNLYVHQASVEKRAIDALKLGDNVRLANTLEIKRFIQNAQFIECF